MKGKHLKNMQALIIACLCGFAAQAQITPDRLKQFIVDEKQNITTEVKEFYTLFNYKTAWIGAENKANRDILFHTLKLSSDIGLQEKDYQFNYIESLRNGILHLQNANDSLQAELRITDAAIHFYSDIAYGNIKPALGHNGLNYVPACYSISDLLQDHVSKNALQLLQIRLSPPLPEIRALENRIRLFNTVMADTNFREVIIVSNKGSAVNAPLLTKLFQLGITGTVDTKMPDSVLKQKVKEAQRQFNLLADGVLRSTIIRELNVPVSVRLQQVTLSLNYYRWLYCLIQNQPVIVVNIPAAYLKVYSNNGILLEMRMIVGKPSTPTPTLTSKVDEVILYPYWHVPYSIATKEILPLVKRNPSLINTGNYQVLNAAGKIVDPHSINWNSLSRNYFPYIIRQSTGCDNSLGLLKLNFYSPFGVYLHDTPNKNLFLLNKRYFSHGCMRMEQPMELGRLILKDNSVAIDTLEEKGCLYNQSPVVVKAREKIPVIVWYNPAGIDSAGRILYYEDVYGKFSWMKKK